MAGWQTPLPVRNYAALTAMLNNIYGGHPDIPTDHLVTGTFVVAKYDGQWLRCQVGHII